VGAIFVIFSLSVCGEEKTELRIEGVVTDANDESPINGATISLKQGELWEPARLLSSTQTNQQGSYYLSYTVKGFCGEALFILKAEADGYQPNSITSVNPSLDGSYVRCTESIQTINFQLEPD
jgi:hypothetical protein